MGIMEFLWPAFFPLLAAVNILVKKHSGVAALENFLMWQLAVGFGLLCLKLQGKLLTVMVICAGLFVFSAGLGHLRELVVNGNTATNNAGAVMYVNLVYPFFLAVLLVLYRKKAAQAWPLAAQSFLPAHGQTRSNTSVFPGIFLKKTMHEKRT